MFATNSDLQSGLRLSPFLDTDFNQLADSLLIDRLKRIVGENSLLKIIGQEASNVVTGETESHLCQIIRAKGEELCDFRDLI